MTYIKRPLGKDSYNLYKKKTNRAFILRRTKKEVLTELPEKTVTVLNNEMEDEQKKIYLHLGIARKPEKKCWIFKKYTYGLLFIY